MNAVGTGPVLVPAVFMSFVSDGAVTVFQDTFVILKRMKIVKEIKSP